MLSEEQLYGWVRNLPIVDWHNHLDLAMLAADRPLGSLYEVWVKSDPYKHRAMRICGEPEELITGAASGESSAATDGDVRCPGAVPNGRGRPLSGSTDGDVRCSEEAELWAAWMRTLPKLVGNPIFAWARMELAFLGLDPEPYLHGRGENVSLADWTPSKLLKAFKVEWMSPCLSATQLSDNGRPRPLNRTTDVPVRWGQTPDNGRPRPLFFAEPIAKFFSEARRSLSDHFSQSLRSSNAHARNLPHVAHDNALVFITFRLADSLPARQLQIYAEQKERWIKSHPQPWDEATRDEYACEIEGKIDQWLDAGYGSCVLADERCRKIVEDSLEYFNGIPGQRTSSSVVRGKTSRYVLHGYVVMPNHVHVLVELANGSEMTKIIQGWKSFSARKINEICGTTGPVWREEYFDRLIRDAKHYENVLRYISENEQAACAIVRNKCSGFIPGQRTSSSVEGRPAPGQRTSSSVVELESGGKDLFSQRTGTSVVRGDLHSQRTGTSVVRFNGRGRPLSGEPSISTDGDVRCPGETRTVPSLRLNAGDAVSAEDLVRFQAAGCRVVDISVDDTASLDADFESLSAIASFAAAHGWTMLLHLGALRETSERLRTAAGPAGGFAGMRAPVDPTAVARFLNRLESVRLHTDNGRPRPLPSLEEEGNSFFLNGRGRPLSAGIFILNGRGRPLSAEPSISTDGDVRCPNALPRTILLSLNPEAHAQLAVLAGSFNGAGLPGKVQLGPAWWWCDHEEGIRDVLEKNAAYGVLSTFVGMTTDSRSLLSFVRHDYFRRILCRWTAEKIASGAFPDDETLVRPLLENICYFNSKEMLS